MAVAAAKAVALSATIPSKPSIKLHRAPKVGEVYWCDFSPYNWPPEFDDKHLVVVIRTGGRLENAAHMVLPLTKRSQQGNAYGHKMLVNPNPGSADESWAVCDHLYTVASERLDRLRDSKGQNKPPEKIDGRDLKAIGLKFFTAIGTFRSLVLGGAAAPSISKVTTADATLDPPDKT